MDFHLPEEECAVVGVSNLPDASNYAYLGLYALQHRGQEGAGIVSYDGSKAYVHRDMGLVADVFGGDVVERLQGNVAIGHNRYATCGSKDAQNLQPLFFNFNGSSYAISHNGNLTNTAELRQELEGVGALFSTTSDTEVIAHLIARTSKDLPFEQRLIEALSRVKGAFSLIVLSEGRLWAVRDPAGVRPLSIASLDGGHVIASETCAFDLIGAKFVRDVQPGEIVCFTPGSELTSYQLQQEASPKFCVFEHIYFSRPDSNIDGINVYHARKQFGVELFKEHPVDVDMVVPVPDSGVPAGMGFAAAAKTAFEFGLIRNHYVGRTFIEPAQSIRNFGVKVKLNPNSELLKGKKIVLVDDSIVRGTTCKKIIKMCRAAGAKEVHFRVSSPPTIGPCYYGIDTPVKEQLIANSHTTEEVCEYIGADSLGYLSLEGVYRALDRKSAGFCDGCFSGNYPLGESDSAREQIPDYERLSSL